jgi:rubrerythrin
MEESIEAQAEREAKEIWEKKLKNDFDEHINKCLMETLRELKNHLNSFDETMKTHMNELDQKFKKKFEEQMSSLKQQSNINQNITNPFSQFNNNNINNNENNNNEGNNKKSTATFFYINKDNIKENKIKVYRKQKINISNSQNKFIKTNKNKLYDNNSHKNIKVKRYFFPKPILNKNNNHHKIVNNNSNNILLTDYNNNRNIDNVDYNINNGKKRICSYKASFSKLFKNRSYNNVLTESNCKNIEEKQYLSDKNINDAEYLLNSPKRTIKRVSNSNDNRETNVNSDNNNDLFDEIIKLNGYKYNKKGLKEIKINYIYNNRINYNTYKENYIYKRNKIKPEKKYSFKNYNKGPKNMKTDNNYYKISNINQNKSKKNYLIIICLIKSELNKIFWKY